MKAKNRYSANKSRSQGRKYFAIIFRHPLRKDSKGRSGLRIRRGLGTSDAKIANKLVKQMNEILGNSFFWSLDAKSDAIKLYDPIIISAFYDVLEQKPEIFIVAFESGLGHGWQKIEAADAKDALETFKKREPYIYRLCQNYGTIHVAKEEII